MSKMTRRTVPSRRIRPVTHYSRLAPRSIVVLLNMTDNYWEGRTVGRAFPRMLARTYYWAFPAGTFINSPRAPRWVDPRNRGL